MAAFLVLATVAWAFGNPPGAAPDEPAHYVKALGAGGGQLAGAAVHAHPEEIARLRDPEVAASLERLGRLGAAPAGAGVEARSAALGERWQARTAREFSVPADLAVSPGSCLGAAAADRTCLLALTRPLRLPYARTYVGTYQPFAYVVPGLAARAMDAPGPAIRAGRLAGGAVCVALLALAALLSARGPGGAAGLAGLAAALPPAVVVAVATINPSGLEIAGAVCFTAALLAATRERSAAAWAGVAAGGAALAVSRSFGPLFVLFATLAVLAVAGRAGWRRALAPPRAPALAAAGVVALAAAAAWAWEFTRQPHPGLRAADVAPGVRDAFSALPKLARNAVGVVGAAADVDLPLVLALAWGGLLLALAVAALRLGDRRERLALAGVAVAILATVFALAVAVRPTGFGVQARYLLPAVVVWPLLAGEVLRRHTSAPAPRAERALVIGVVAVAAGVHVAAWSTDAHTWAGASWVPPAGWAPWATAMVAGALAYVTAGVLAARRAGSGRRRA